MNALGGEYLVRRVALDDSRDEYSRKFGEGATERGRVAGLDAVIQLVGERALELLDDADHVDALANLGVRREKARQLAKVLDVVGQLGANVRALYLHDHLAPVAQAGGVHLPEAGGAEWLLIEFLEELAHPRAQLFLDGRVHILHRDLSDVVLKRFELVDVRLRKEIGSRGEDLAEFHVGWSELDESLAECGCFFGRRRVVDLTALRIGSDALEALLFREVGESVAREQTHRDRKSVGVGE